VSRPHDFEIQIALAVRDHFKPESPEDLWEAAARLQDVARQFKLLALHRERMGPKGKERTAEGVSRRG